MKSRSLLSAVTVALLVGACGRSAPPAEAPTPPAADVTAPAPAPVALPRVPSPPGAAVTIVSPADGAIVASPVKVVFAVEGMALAPAGDATPNSGHHHLLVDVPIPADLGAPIIKDAQHLHFGQAQTEAEVELAPGTHTLQLLLGDANHVPHDPPVQSAPITITVQ
jgi:hypothetical protein